MDGGLVNAVVHRSYSIAGDHIRITIFDDHIEFESPGWVDGERVGIPVPWSSWVRVWTDATPSRGCASTRSSSGPP